MFIIQPFLSVSAVDVLLKLVQCNHLVDNLGISHLTVLCIVLLQCKKLVFEYGPLILVNAEEFLVKNDICTLLRACPAEEIVLRQPGSAYS